MPHYLSLPGDVPEVGRIVITDSMGVELTVMDFQLQARDQNASPVFGFTAGGTVISMPKIRNGVVYASSCDKNIYAIDASTGKERWRFSAGDIVFDFALTDDSLYAACYDGCVYALSLEGTVRWKFQTQDKVACMPAVAGDTVFFVGKDGYLYAVDKNEGTLKWKFHDGTPSFGNPVVANSTLYIGFLSGNCYAIDTDGAVKWKFTARGPTGTATIGKHIIFPSFDGNVYALRQDGTLAWTFITNAKNLIWKPALLRDGIIYFVSLDCNFYAVDENGTLRWKTPLDAAVLGPPQIAGDTLLCGSVEGSLYHIDRKTGTVRSKTHIDGKPICTAVVGERVFFSCYDCKLLCTDLEGNLIWSFPTSLSYVAPFNFQSIRPQILSASQLQQAQDIRQEAEAYKSNVRQDAAGGSVYSGLNIGYAGSFNQYTKRAKYVK